MPDKSDQLIKYYNELLIIKQYLVKKGKARYTCKTTENKLVESKQIVQFCEKIIDDIPTDEKKLFAKCVQIYENIRELFSQITILSKPPITTTSQESSKKMEFDLKAACDLIPVMDDSGKNTKRIIDAIEMYADMLEEKNIPLLIKFVLKSRLSENAKLRLSDNYHSVTDLIKDLKLHLLPKKSFTAIQTKLQNISQGWKTIDQFGTDIEKLMTELTISQAEGDSTKYSVLKPINEKIALKRFSEGIRDARLSTIIASRNYSSLKDAIQGAKDEEVSSASTSAEANAVEASPRGQYRGGRSRNSNFSHRFQRGRPYDNYGRGNYQNANFSRGGYHHYGDQQEYFNRDAQYSNRRGNRGSYNRGYSTRVYRNQNHNVYSAQENCDAELTPSPENNNQPTQFFRD